ncbi:hypothetical protein OPQ81_003641 [Rhizoctonia solani]|nr:hypothetical protein OPQ81_003641 [Rhizoctonia solani]
MSLLANSPKELTLVSTEPLGKAKSYFAALKSKFKLMTPKISENSLPSITVSDSIKGVLYRHHVRDGKAPDLKLGTYVQELLCLVPLQLVIVRGGQLSLMNNGVGDPDHNILSLDEDIAHMTDMLSLGWYEPLLRFRSIPMPVRVISSIGEQGVGKTYSLDHFANTSLGVCGDRDTKGIWLSCTPTDKYLLVVLDFKGVHLTEQNTEVSALMGFFSAAVSNLVILRNNFTATYCALASKLAKGLQSLTMFMKPDDNTQIFNSVLAIVVKDISDPIAYGDVKE